MDNIVQTAKKAGNFKFLIRAVEVAGLSDTLSGRGPFTIFAPSDDAFRKLTKDKYETLLTNKEELKKILTYHVVSGKITSKDAKTMNTMKTIEGENVKLNTAKGMMVNTAHVTTADIECSNGEIHIIDEVLMPVR